MTLPRCRILALLFLLVLVSLVLASCGRKGAPEPPEGSTYPQQYPSPTYQ